MLQYDILTFLFFSALILKSSIVLQFIHLIAWAYSFFLLKIPIENIILFSMFIMFFITFKKDKIYKVEMFLISQALLLNFDNLFSYIVFINSLIVLDKYDDKTKENNTFIISNILILALLFIIETQGANLNIREFHPLGEKLSSISISISFIYMLYNLKYFLDRNFEISGHFLKYAQFIFSLILYYKIYIKFNSESEYTFITKFQNLGLFILIVYLIKMINSGLGIKKVYGRELLVLIFLFLINMINYQIEKSINLLVVSIFISFLLYTNHTSMTFFNKFKVLFLKIIVLAYSFLMVKHFYGKISLELNWLILALVAINYYLINNYLKYGKREEILNQV